MGLLEDLEESKPTVQGTPCTVHQVMLDRPDEAEGIWRIVMEGDLPGAEIGRLFGKYGYSSGSDNVNRHRRGECACRRRMPERYDS